uniref:Uncharacterized protein n=1 Tax=Oryza rufipogon TaxID=4529 RepID=A0A0E0PI04_ORYRU
MEMDQCLYKARSDLELEAVVVGADLDPPAGDEVVDDEVAGRLPGHLPQLDGAELDADRHARPHRERHEPGLLLLQQLRRHGAVQPRLASDGDGEDEHSEQRPAHAPAAPPPAAPAPTPTGWIRW